MHVCSPEYNLDASTEHETPEATFIGTSDTFSSIAAQAQVLQQRPAEPASAATLDGSETDHSQHSIVQPRDDASGVYEGEIGVRIRARQPLGALETGISQGQT